MAIRWRRRVAHHRLGQPRPDIRVALGLEGAEAVDRQPGGRCHQPGLCVPDGLSIGLVPTHVRVLHDVLSLNPRAEHPIRKAEEPCAVGLEPARRGVRHLTHPALLMTKTGNRPSV